MPRGSAKLASSWFVELSLAMVAHDSSSREELVSDDDYIFPRDAVSDLIQKVPDELRQLLIDACGELNKQCSESWPDVPYHYGQGRIREYEVWRDSLSEQDQKQELAAVRIRYEAYNDAMAQFLVWVMAKQGHDISKYLRVVRHAGGTAGQRWR
jgi:hypothetical protein